MITWKAKKCSPSCAIWMAASCVALCEFTDRKSLCFFFTFVHHLDIRSAVKWKIVYDRNEHTILHATYFNFHCRTNERSCRMSEWQQRRRQRTFMDIGYGISIHRICFRHRSRAFIHRKILALFYDGKWRIRYYRILNGSKKLSFIRFMDSPRTDEFFIYYYILNVMVHEIPRFSRWHFCRSVKMHGISNLNDRRQWKILLQLNSAYYLLPMTTLI